MFSTIVAIILTLLVLSVIVMIHEWGHFIVAKLFKVNIEEFSIGMGPLVFGKVKNGTQYSLRCLPLGGYCKMTDKISDIQKKPDENTGEDIYYSIANEDASVPKPVGKYGYNEISVPKRTLISFAGPLMNLVLSAVLISALAMLTGISTTEVLSVNEGSAAEEAGFLPRDVVVEYGGHNIHSRTMFSYYAGLNGGAPVQVAVKRGRNIVEMTVKPTLDEDTGHYIMGVRMDYKAPVFDIMNMNEDKTLNKAPLYSYITSGFWNTVDDIRLTFFSFGGLIQGTVSIKDFSGPIGMVSMVDDVVETTVKISYAAFFLTMLEFAALISISLGIINLLPLPALDGGRIFIYIFEIIFNREMPQRVENAIHTVGFVLLMGLGLYIAVVDIIKIV